MKLKIIAALLSSLVCAYTSAATVNVSQEFNIQNPDFKSSNYISFYSNEFAAPVTLQAGDTVNLTYRFNVPVRHQLTMQGGMSQTFDFGLGGAAGSPANNSFITNQTFNFIGLDGVSLGTNYLSADSAAGDAEIGAFFSDNYLPNGSQFVINGIQTSFVIGSMDQLTADYSAAYFRIFADNGLSTSVPEPTSIALFGFGLLAFLSRRRAAQ